MPVDPRSIVTPDAFSVAPELLGTRLASPGRRLLAFLADVVGIAFLQLLGWRILAGVAALMLFRLATRRPEGEVSGLARRTIIGCAGTTILLIIVVATWAVPYITNQTINSVLSELDTGDPAATENVEELLAGFFGDSARSDPEAATEDPAAQQLRRELAETRSLLLATEADLDETRDELEAAQSQSTLFAWLRDAADEVGLVFGWGTVYFTLFLSLWKGRTPGKRLLDLRVVRLNGQPMGLYMSLERAGGYAAGVATGLLGFAQMWWDPNRQAIHDKIAETVVVRASLPKVRYVQEPGPTGS